MRGRRFIVLAAGMLMSVPLSAHHGGAVFDIGKSVTLKGTVTQWVYSNPHLLLMLDVKGEDGTVVKWVAETQAPSIMYPAGYRKNSFKAGDEVSVTVQPAQNGRPIGRILKVITANGTTLGLTAEAPIYPPGR